MLRQLYHYKWLVLRLFWINFFSTYRKTKLGIIWSFTLPLVSVGAYVFLRLILTVPYDPATEVHPMAYVVYGVTFWLLFASLIQGPISAVNKHGALIKETKLPLLGAIFAGFGQSMFDTLLRTAVVVPALILTGSISFDTLPYGFLVIVFAIILFFSIGVLLLPIWVIFPDIQQILQIIFSYMIFFSLVIFPLDPPAPWSLVMDINPLALMIDSSRGLVSLGNHPGWEFITALGAVSLTLLITAMVVLSKVEEYVRDAI